MSGQSEIHALSRLLDALYQCVTEAKAWESFKNALCEWLEANSCEFHLPEGIALVPLPNALSLKTALRDIDMMPPKPAFNKPMHSDRTYR